MLIMLAVGIVGVSMTLIENFYMLIFGRVVYGLSVGVSSVCMPRYVEEFVPLHKYGICIALYAFSMNIGTLIALTSAIILPKDDDTDAILDCHVTWRLILGFPLFLYVCQAIGFLYINFDGPSFYLACGDYKWSFEDEPL